MLPVVNIAGTYNTIPPPLVNTAVPGSAVLHAPEGTVSPSVSTAQVDNNTRSNVTPPPAPPDTSIASVSADSSSFTVTAADSGSTGSAQTAFITQLIAQDSSPETQVVLLQYEKLIALSNVKFKPSNALKPPAEPASLFGQILHQDKPAAPVVTPQVQPAQEPPPVQTTVQSAPPQEAATQPQPSVPDTTQATVPAPAQPDVPAAQPQAISAYAASVTRQALQQFGAIAELA